MPSACISASRMHSDTSDMQCLLAHGPGNYTLERMPMPVPGEGELLLRTLAIGVCASDAKMYAGGDLFWKRPGGRVSAPLPVVPGHEFVGVVHSFGPGPRQAEHAGLSEGDLVVVEQLVACRECWFCLHDGMHKCDKLKILGQGLDGPMSDFVKFPSNAFVHKVPTGITEPWHALFAEPLATAIRAVDRAELPRDSTATVVVIGCGTVGLCVIAALKAHCPTSRVVALDLHEYKLALSRTAGADAANSSSDASPEKLNLNEGRGADVVFEVSGSASGILSATALVRKMGRIVNLSICGKKAQHVDWDAISAGKELSIVGSSLGHGSWQPALHLIANGKLPVGQMATHRLPLRLWKEGLELAGRPDPSNGAVKVVLFPGAHKCEPILTPAASMPAPAASPLDLGAAPPPGSPFCLKGSVALVTGSARGIGSAIALELAARGAVVVVHGTRQDSPSLLGAEGPRTLDALAAAIAAQSRAPCISVCGDLASAAGVAAVLEQARAKLGGRGIDALVCCAGGNIAGVDGVAGSDKAGKPEGDSALGIAEADARDVVDRNLMTAVLCAQAVVPGMVQRRYGRVVMIGSVAGAWGRSGGAMYAVAKAAMHSYMRCLAEEMRPHNITVNCVAPGPTVTERYLANLGDAVSADMLEAKSLHRYGRPEDTARAVAMCLSPDAAFVSGQVIRVDGGMQLFPA